MRANLICRLALATPTLQALEETLAAAGVGRLVIPSVNELLPMWTAKFGYARLQEPVSGRDLSQPLCTAWHHSVRHCCQVCSACSRHCVML
jgi:hypothetical protein